MHIEELYLQTTQSFSHCQRIFEKLISSLRSWNSMSGDGHFDLNICGKETDQFLTVSRRGQRRFVFPKRRRFCQLAQSFLNHPLRRWKQHVVKEEPDHNR